MKTLVLGGPAFTCLALAGCDGGSSKKPVNVKPVDESKQVQSPGEKFKNPGATDKPGAGGGAPPSGGEKK